MIVTLLEVGMLSATQKGVPSPYTTIQSAITAASSGDTILIAAGTYSESVSVSKSLTLLGAGSSTVIKPLSGSGITISANNVKVQSLRVTGSTSNGISTSGASNLMFTSVTCDSNKNHGLSISGNCSNIVVNGGTFNANGTGRGDGTGAGINFNATGGKVISTVSISGSMTANNNTTAGIWAYADAIHDSVKAVTIGATGSVTLTSNGGAGVILFGNVVNATITATFTKGAANAAGVLAVSTAYDTPYAPLNTLIKKSTFNTGYTSSTPAISLSDFGEAENGFITFTSPYNVSADSNEFNTTGIDSLIWDFNDDNTLGLVTHTHDNILPVELVNFDAERTGHAVLVHWQTATETNNYGFNVERKEPNAPGAVTGIWKTLGFVSGKGTTSVPHSYSFTDIPESNGVFDYRLKQIDRDGAFIYSDVISVTFLAAPDNYGMSQNFPNPFNPSTTISFTLGKTERTTLKVYDMLGREIAKIFDGVAEGGNLYSITFNGSKFASGIYIYRLESEGISETKKMLLIK
ncbi:MAG TPA: T9SS type A sorting domain-containing protein [Bacteroidota bacterium]|nr:T9SS type A sorting domain-containing protein [Bacteroidota bacterium]